MALDIARIDEQIAAVLGAFDFEKVHRVMVTLEWIWTTCDDKTPTLEQLKEGARELMAVARKECIENDGRACRMATGGFYAKVSDHDVQLGFRVTESERHLEEGYWV